MSDLREAIAKALYGHRFRVDDPVDSARWAKFRDEYLDQADVVLGVVHEHADIEAAAGAIETMALGGSFHSWDYLVQTAAFVVELALGGSEKPEMDDYPGQHERHWT